MPKSTKQARPDWRKAVKGYQALSPELIDAFLKSLKLKPGLMQENPAIASTLAQTFRRASENLGADRVKALTEALMKNAYAEGSMQEPHRLNRANSSAALCAALANPTISQHLDIKSVTHFVATMHELNGRDDYNTLWTGIEGLANVIKARPDLSDDTVEEAVRLVMTPPQTAFELNFLTRAAAFHNEWQRYPGNMAQVCAARPELAVKACKEYKPGKE